jgi:hypothetical protein
MKSCRTVGRGYDWLLQSALRSRGARSKIIRLGLLGAGPRKLVMNSYRWSRASPKARIGCRLPDGVPRSGIDTSGLELGVSADPRRSADTAGWRACVASAALQPDTRGYSIELGDGWGETAPRIL